MRSRLKNIWNKTMDIAAIPGRFIASLGTNLLGSRKALNFIYRRDIGSSVYTHPLSIISLFANFYSNSVTRVPSMLRRRLIDEVSDEELVINQNQNLSKKVRALSLTLSCMCYLSTRIGMIFVGLGAYNAGKIISEFIATQSDSDLNDETWKWAAVHILALYLLASNIKAFSRYVVRPSENNFKQLIQRLKFGKEPLNKKVASGAVVSATLSMMTSTAFAYLSAEDALQGVNQDLAHFPASMPEWVQIPELAITISAGCSALSNLINEASTSIPSLYQHSLELINKNVPAAEHANYGWIKSLRYTSYVVCFVDAGLVSFQGVCSLALLANKLFDFDPYGAFLGFAAVCGTSKLIAYYSFYEKVGIDNFMGDLEKYADSRRLRFFRPAPPEIIEQTMPLLEDRLAPS